MIIIIIIIFLGFQEISFLEFNAFACEFVKERKMCQNITSEHITGVPA